MFIPKSTGVLLLPVPEPDQLRGLAKGARTDGYRDHDHDHDHDREDRY